MKEVVNTVRAVLMFVLLLVILIFCFQNMQEVDIKFFSMKMQQLPLFIALMFTLAVGLLIGFLAGMIKGTQNKNKAVEDAKEMEKLKGIEEQKKLEAQIRSSTNASNSNQK